MNTSIYMAPVCKTIEVQVRKSVLLAQSEQDQEFGINNWNEADGEEYDF